MIFPISGKTVNNNTVKYLNPREIEVISRLSYERVSVVKREQLVQWFNFPARVLDKTISRLNKKGILRSIKKGVYFYSPLDAGPAGININEFLVPPILFPKGNYYVGYTSMFNYYGLLEQISQTMYILNTAIQRQKFIGNMLFKIVKISPRRMYGIENFTIQNSKVMVSDWERTLVDLIYFPEPVGGLRKALEILKFQVEAQKIDIKKLVKYAVRFPSISTRKRIGFVLEQGKVSDAVITPLIKSIKNTSLNTLYGSKSRKGPINNKWKVIIDDAQQ